MLGQINSGQGLVVCLGVVDFRFSDDLNSLGWVLYRKENQDLRHRRVRGLNVIKKKVNMRIPAKVNG